MAVKASVLGTPNIRVSSFKGKISVLEELEKKYRLTNGFLPGENEAILSKISELLQHDMSYTTQFHNSTLKMLNEKIDVASFMVWFIENYPQSAAIMKSSPEYQNRFIANQIEGER